MIASIKGKANYMANSRPPVVLLIIGQKRELGTQEIHAKSNRKQRELLEYWTLLTASVHFSRFSLIALLHPPVAPPNSLNPFVASS